MTKSVKCYSSLDRRKRSPECGWEVRVVTGGDSGPLVLHIPRLVILSSYQRVCISTISDSPPTAFHSDKARLTPMTPQPRTTMALPCVIGGCGDYGSSDYYPRLKGWPRHWKLLTTNPAALANLHPMGPLKCPYVPVR